MKSRLAVQKSNLKFTANVNFFCDIVEKEERLEFISSLLKIMHRNNGVLRNVGKRFSYTRYLSKMIDESIISSRLALRISTVQIRFKIKILPFMMVITPARSAIVFDWAVFEFHA